MLLSSGPVHYRLTATDFPVPRSPMMSTPPIAGSTTFSMSASFISSWAAIFTNGSSGARVAVSAAALTAAAARRAGTPGGRSTSSAVPASRGAGRPGAKPRRLTKGVTTWACRRRPPARRGQGGTRAAMAARRCGGGWLRRRGAGAGAEAEEEAELGGQAG